MGIKTVLIDFDGTLANTNGIVIRSFQHTYRTFQGREEKEAVITRSFGEPLRTTMARVFGAEYEDEAVEVYRSYQMDRFESLIEPFPGMDELVRQLKAKGYQTALVTSRVKESAVRGLRKFGLEEEFDVITTVDDLMKHKPDPECIYVTLEKLGASPEEAVMLGDSRFDILCARNAGVRSILVDWSVMPEEERQAVRADFLAKTPEEILKWITDR